MQQKFLTWTCVMIIGKASPNPPERIPALDVLMKVGAVR
jgi:hypothetical protein